MMEERRCLQIYQVYSIHLYNSYKISKQKSCSPVAKANPLGKNVTALMSDSCPGKVCLQTPSLMSHNLAEASQAPLTNMRPSGDKDNDITSPVWPVNERLTKREKKDPINSSNTA
uniref:Uncharacterized protein n=1 Tax=Romanomermis culicivorax TaxID=13658 RepID=A0A915KV73_ROMCU